MKAILVTTASLVLTCAVLGNAYYQKKQFYPSVVYITKSNPSMAVLYIQAFVFVVLMGKLLRKVFFGQLRAAEMENSARVVKISQCTVAYHMAQMCAYSASSLATNFIHPTSSGLHLIERSWYAVTETCLAFTVFRDDFSPRFVVLFTLLLFLKCFHWLGEDRVDYMERSPIISWVFHLRIISLCAVLGLVDAYFINHAYYSTILKGASVQLVFGFEYAILFTVVVTILLKYLLHSVDLQSENPWENKAVYMLYSELVLGFIKAGLYMSFMIIMIKVHTFPLFAIRPMYLTMRSFKKALNDVILSRRAIRNMNTLYPDVTQEELETGDNVCIICREEMVPPGCKKLPCNHIFHTSCLRSWFQRQQTCPTCRMDVLRGAPPARPTPVQQPAPPPQPQMPNFPGMFPGFPNQFPGWPPAAFPQVPPQQAAGQTTSTTATTTTSPTQISSTSTPTSTTTATGTTATPGTSAGIPGSVPGSIPPPFPPTGMPPFMPPPFMFPPPMMGMMAPVPPMPTPDFTGLTDEEVRALEGGERRQVEARVKCLKNIQVLLDAAMVQIQQYTSVVTAQGMPGINVSGTESFTSSASTKEDLNLPKPGTHSPKTEERPLFDLGENDTNSPLEGAVGYTPPEEVRAAIDDLEGEEEEGDEKNEIRRRRLQRFSQSELSST